MEALKTRVANWTKMFTSKREWTAGGIIALVLTSGDCVSKICVTVLGLGVIWALSQKPTQE